MKARKALGFIFLGGFIAAESSAQEHHYWTNQFGSRASLMSGAMVGGVRDTSAGYYNPAALGFLKASTFSASGNGYQLEMIDITDGAGSNKNVDSTHTNVVPLLISGTWLLAEEFSLGYSLLAKNSSSISLSGRHEDNALEGLDSNPGFISGFDPVTSEPILGGTFEGTEVYRGQFLHDTEVSEYWGGLSLSKALQPDVSVGATLFVAMRDQRFNATEFARMTNPISEYIASEDVFLYGEFYSVRTLLKLGIAAEIDSVKLGATITSPSMHLFGSGTVAGGAGRYREDDAIGYIADDRQEDLDAEYKSPLSIALGAEYALTDKTNIAATLEWFDSQDSYEVITPKSKEFFVTGTLGVIDSKEILQIEDQAESVLNLALALEHQFNDRIKLYSGFRTDFTTFPGYASEASYQKMGINNWDLYHFTFGVGYKREASELALGLTYSFGEQDRFVQLATINPDDRIGDDFILALNSERYSKASYKALGLTIGYTHFFK